MTEIVKSQWATDGDSMRLSMPIAKVDTEQRLVSGFATLDNVDSQGDIVTAEASAKAFARARGNIREMHQPIAVGKIVDFREDEFYHVDPVSGETKFYRGIFVTAYVSKGAEATWEKVLDGTLTGFSIGGNILEQDNEFDKASGKTVRVIKDYDLIELSLVDNPANQLANVFSISKASNGSVTVKGMAVEVEIENVFWCKDDQRAQVISAESANCAVCEKTMENIGWFEQGGDHSEKVKSVVTKFLGLNVADENANGEGGVVETMSDEVTKSETPAEEVAETEAVEAEVETAEEPVVAPEEVEETAAEEEEVNPDEVPDEQEEISKKIDELHDTIKDSLEKTRSETAEQVAALETKIEEVTKSFESKASELEKKFSEFGESLEAAKGRLAEFEKALEVVNSSDAVKKSGEVTSPEPVQKSASVWNGAFSVDNLIG